MLSCFLKKSAAYSAKRFAVRGIVGALLCAALIALPAPAYAAGEADPLAGIKSGDLIYFGTPNNAIHFDGAWRVLDPEKANTGESGMFLLSENLIGSDTGGGVFFLDERDPKNNDYQGSDAQKWCSFFLETAFSDAERAAMIPTYKSDAAFAKEHTFEIPFSKADGSWNMQAVVNFDAAEYILNGDKIFLLSAEEADNISYGFDGEESRIAGFDGTAASWWLRSPHDPSFPIDVGIVFFNGWLLDFFENQNNVFGTGPVYMRPAFNLDRSKVVSAEEIADGEWTLLLEGEAPDGTTEGEYQYEEIKEDHAAGGPADGEGTFTPEGEDPDGMAGGNYQFGARGEIKENRAALRPLWILAGAGVLIIAVVVSVIVVIIRRVRRVRKKKDTHS